MWYDTENVQYNRFTNLDGIEDKILFYLLSEKDKNEEQTKKVHNIWRLLTYNDAYALINDDDHPLPTYRDMIKLIDNGNIDQSNKRLFRYPFVEDSFVEQCSQIRVYIDKIIPINHLVSKVNIGIEVVIHNKISTIINNLYNENEELINPTENYPLVTYKNRCTVLLKEVLGLLNGADIAGVGKIQFNREADYYSVAEMGLWNNRNFYGFKIISTCLMSGVA